MIPNTINFIKATLDIEYGQYNTWSVLFKTHVRAYHVLDHIIPPSKNDKKPISCL